MSRQTELMVKISVVGLELVYIALIGAGLYLNSQVQSSGMGLVITGGVLFLIFNCMLYCYKDKLPIAIAVIDAAADYYAATKRLVFVSLFFFALHIIMIALMGATVVYMYSKSVYGYSPNGPLSYNQNTYI